MKPEAASPVAQSQLYRDRSTDSGGAFACVACGGDSTCHRLSLCARCLLDAAFEPETDEVFADSVPEAQTYSGTARRLGPYELIAEIGRGGMGIIYRAVDLETGQIVAVKTVSPEYAQHPETLERFRREAVTAQSLDHPHSMPILRVGCSVTGVPFFSMKLAVGGSLHQLMEKYRGRWRQAAELMIKICRAVHHGHERGVLHRDLKPGNILFDEDYEPLVSDFGLAKQIVGSDDLTLTCTVLGTPSYVSPEQAAGQGRVLSPASDIYSLGAILYELLTGRPPFIGDNPLDVLRQVASETPSRPSKYVPTVPKSLETICLRCLERKPADRYDSVQELVDDLRCWLQTGKIVPVPLHARVVKRFIQSRSFRKPLSIIAAVLTIAWIAAGVVNRYAGPPAEAVGIAVAIDSLNQGPHLNVIAEQITDELKRGLAETRAFEIKEPVPTGSAGASTIFDPLAYGRACGTRTVLTGSVREAGGKIKLVTRLIRCDTGEVIWRHDNSIVTDTAAAHQRSAIQPIINDLRSRCQAGSQAFARSRQYTPLPEAQTFYTKALEFSRRSTQADLESAVRLFRKASELDPKFSSARAMLAFALWMQADTYGENDKISSALAVAKETLVIDPNSDQAHRVIAACYSKSARNEEALTELWRCVQLNPQSVGGCQSLGMCLREMGRLDQAIPWLQRAADLAPDQGSTSGTLGEAYALSGLDQQAETVFNHAIELDNDRSDLQNDLCVLRVWQKRYGDARQLCTLINSRFPGGRFNLTLTAWIEFCGGDSLQARSHFEKLRAENSYEHNWEYYGAVNPSSALAYLCKQAGENERARMFAAEAIAMDRELLKQSPRNARVLHDLAATSLITGTSETALKYLEEAASAGWIEWRSTAIDPRFADLTGHPRFKQLVNHSMSASASR